MSTDVTGIGRKSDSKRQGRGLGMAADKLVLAPVFSVFGVCRTSGSKLAFKVREAALIDGEWHDDIMKGILAHEFSAQKDRPQGK